MKLKVTGGIRYIYSETSNPGPHYLTENKKITGAACPNRHPLRCFRCCKYGERDRQGCKKGKECEYLHPKLCRDSVLRRECLKEGCTFVHLKFTRRYPYPPPVQDDYQAPQPRAQGGKITILGKELVNRDNLIHLHGPDVIVENNATNHRQHTIGLAA